MNWRIFFLLAITIIWGTACDNGSASKEVVMVKKDIATCYGNTPCKACTSCNYCKWCKAGGTCGICISNKKNKSEKYKTKAPSPSSSGRCQAITKKGTQCSRSSRSKGYCWQHGG